jgi:hypothetical protein
MEKLRNYNVVSINEAIWRTGWNLEKDDFIQKINKISPDSLVMTRDGVKVNIKSLVRRSKAGSKPKI